MAKRISKSIRIQVEQRAKNSCEYCLSQAIFSPDPFSVEHIIPKSKGGTSRIDNLAFSCQGCNNRKYTHTEAIDPVTNDVVPLFHPREQKWKKHFQWNKDKSMIIGISPSGRATLEKLSLNRVGVVNLRKVLYEIGKHPPKVLPEK